jgi:hypothetical protein
MIETIHEFDFDAGQAPENVALLRDGTIVATLLMAGAVWWSTGVIEQVVPGADGTMAVGLAVDGDDRLYVAVQSPDSDVAGIWRRSADVPRWTRIAAAEPTAGLNGITFDPAGTLYVADSRNGNLLSWRPGMDSLRLWLEDPLLQPTDPTDPVLATGCNGLKYLQHALYVTNTAQACVLRIGIVEGRPAEQLDTVIAGVPADDLAFDSQGNLFLAVHPENTVLRVAPDGARATIATAADGCDGPTAIAVTDDGLAVSNLGILGDTHRPSVLRIAIPVGSPVLPLPTLAD